MAYSSWALKTGAGQGTGSDAGKGIPGRRNSESRSPAGGTLGFGRLCQAGNEMDADSFFPARACGHPQSALNHSLGLESSDSSIFLLFPPTSGKRVGGGGLERGVAEQGPRVMNPPPPTISEVLRRTEKRYSPAASQVMQSPGWKLEALGSCPRPPTHILSPPVSYLVGLKIGGRPLPASALFSQVRCGCRSQL